MQHGVYILLHKAIGLISSTAVFDEFTHFIKHWSIRRKFKPKHCQNSFKSSSIWIDPFKTYYVK